MFKRSLLLAAAGCLAAASVAVPGPALAGVAQPVAKWCAGVKIDAFAGGPKGDAFASTLESGFRQAEADLGPSVTYHYSDWNPNTLLKQISEALAAKPDGIATIGFAGDAATGRFADKLIAAGGIFTSIDMPLPRAEAKYAGRGFGFAGAPNYKAGAALAGEAAARAKLAKGDEAIVWGLKGKGGDRAQRTAGVIDTLTKAGIKVIYEEIDAATAKDPLAGGSPFALLMTKNPKVKLVITDQGALTASAGALAKAAALRPGAVFFAGFELTDASAKAIADGSLNLLLDQQPYLQGYLSVLDICLAKKFGFQGLHIDTAAAFIDKSNVEAVAAMIAKGVR